MDSRAVGKILRSLNVKTSNRRAPEGRNRYLDWEPKLMRKLLRRYMPEPEEFAELFSENSHPGLRPILIDLLRRIASIRF